MIGLDSNVLARYYIEDQTDAEAQHQRLAARRLIESGQSLMVCKTVILELDWVMRGYCGFAPAAAMSVLRHLCELPHVTIEDRSTVEQALSNGDVGLDFADALHHALDALARLAVRQQQELAQGGLAQCLDAPAQPLRRELLIERIRNRLGERQ